MNKVLWVIFLLFLLQGSSHASINPIRKPIGIVPETLLREGNILGDGMCTLQAIARHRCTILVYEGTQYLLVGTINDKTKTLEVYYILKLIHADTYRTVWTKDLPKETRIETDTH